MANATNIEVGKAGTAFFGPTSSTAPTSATSVLVGFSDLGAISTDGLTQTKNESQEPINVWGANGPVKFFNTEGSEVFKVTLMETSLDTLSLVHNGTVVAGAIEVAPGKSRGIYSFVFDVVDDVTSGRRLYVPAGQITAIADITYAPGAPTMYEVTITALNNPATGVAYVEHNVRFED